MNNIYICIIFLTRHYQFRNENHDKYMIMENSKYNVKKLADIQQNSTQLNDNDNNNDQKV